MPLAIYMESQKTFNSLMAPQCFNGLDSLVHVADAEKLHLGTSDFSIGLWVQCEVPLQSALGDLFSKFDPVNRRGINFLLSGSSSGYGAMCDTRHVHFGIDDGYMSDWKDCGKPSSSNTLITRLTVFEGNLYCGIADAENPEDAARVFRYAGGSKWIDCGRLGEDPNHHSVQSLIVHARQTVRRYGHLGLGPSQRTFAGASRCSNDTRVCL